MAAGSPSLRLFDTHAHLDDEQFSSTRSDLVSRAQQAGVERIVAVGTTAASSAESIRIAGEFPQVYAAVGIQPNHCAEAASGDWPRILELSESPKVVAIGETGLDRYWDFTPFPVQQDYFDRHIRLAQQTGLPFIVHMRDCDQDVLEMLAAALQRGELRGVMHSFTGTRDTAEHCLQLGLYISFAGMVTYKKSDELRSIAAAIPDDRLLIETDSPYLSPHPQRSRRPNEPALIVHTARCLAVVRGVDEQTLAEQTTRNAYALFQRASS